MHADCHCNEDVFILHADLMADVGDLKHILTINEAMDISTKLFGEVLCNFSAQENRIVITLLALIKIEDGTAAVIIKTLENLITLMELDTKRLYTVHSPPPRQKKDKACKNKN